VSINSTLPLTKMDEKLILRVLQEYKIHNCEVSVPCPSVPLSVPSLPPPSLPLRFPLLAARGKCGKEKYSDYGRARRLRIGYGLPRSSSSHDRLL
jgi:hypothetical protein